ncbi:hypothetical protein ABPG75_001934 [Micractinium tetrahymenae]
MAEVLKWGSATDPVDLQFGGSPLRFGCSSPSLACGPQSGRAGKGRPSPGPHGEGPQRPGSTMDPHAVPSLNPGQQLGGLGLPQAHDLHEQLVQEGVIREVLGGSQGSLLPIPSLPDAGALPMVDQQAHGLGLSALELPMLAGEPDVASQVRDTNCSAPRAARAVPPSAPLSEDEVDQDDDDDDEEDEPGGGAGAAGGGGPEGNETGSSGRPGRGVKRKKAGKGGGKRNATPGMQGRFSGRLGTKEDEKRLAAECRLIGPLLGGAARGEKSLHTLAKLVRAIAAGSVRAHLEAMEAERQDLRAKLQLLSDGDGQQLLRLQDDNTQLRRELAAKDRIIAEREQQLQAANARLQQQALSQGMAGIPATMELNMQRSGPMQGAPVSLALAAPTAGGISMPICTAPVPASLPVPALVNGHSAAQPQLVVASAAAGTLAAQLAPATTLPALAAPQVTAAAALPTLPVPDATAVAAQQQAQMLAGMQPVVVSMPAPTVPAVQPMLVHTGSGGMNPAMVPQVAQPTATTLSGGTLAAAAAKPALTTISEALSGEAGAVAAAAAAAAVGMHPGLVSTMATTQPQLSGPADAAAALPAPAAAVADQAAQNLNQQAQHLTVQATLHGQAKTHATTQAQQLASQAQLHAQASVQAAVQAEQLKQTIAVLPDTQQAQHAVATVQNLEERAKAHADITTQAVAQARELQEKAQAHAAEQAKAMAQANMLHAHAQSLAVSAQHMEAAQQQVTVGATAQPTATTTSGPAAVAAAPALSGDLMAAAAAMQATAAVPSLPAPVVMAPAAVQVQPQQPSGSVNRSGGDAALPDAALGSLLPSTPTDAAAAAAAAAAQQQLQQAVLAAAAPAAAPTVMPAAAAAAPAAVVPGPAAPAAAAVVPAQLPNGQTVQVVVPQQMVAPAAPVATAALTAPTILQPSIAGAPAVSAQPGADALQQQAAQLEQLAALQQVSVQQVPTSLPAQQLMQAIDMAAVQPQQQPAQQLPGASAVGITPAPAAASAILQPTPQSMPKVQSATVNLEQLGSSAMPSSSGNTAALLEAAARGASRDVAMPAAAPARAPSLPSGPELSTGLTPQVGTLDLPPGIEAIVPNNMPLTGDPASLQAAAAMGPVVSIPHSASEGLPVASGSSM